MGLNKTRLYILSFMIIAVYSAINAQEAVTIDYSPFERPKELAIIKVDSTRNLVQVIADTVIQYGFQITRKDSRDGIIEAQRIDSSLTDCRREF